MKKPAIILLLFVFAGQISMAQTFVATGTVSDQGVPLRYAFVYDKQSKNATYTDSLGEFKLPVNQGAQLTITCKGYVETTLSASDKSAMNIILKKDMTPAGQAVSNEDEKMVEDAFKSVHDDLGKPGVTPFSQATFTTVKETRGSQFLFSEWAHGYIVDAKGNIVQAPTLLLNYNKMTGDLFMTEDRNSVITADKNHIRSFVLFGPQDQQYTFEMMPGISADHFCQVLSAGNKYKIYKLTITKFVPSNYHTDGVVSTGNLYDEYADNSSYYISNLTTTAFQPLNLNKKSIKLAFAAEGNKIDDFLATHKIKENDAWVKALGDAMNQ
jgi:hypothetical protein